jgi:hypothetical protein
MKEGGVTRATLLSCACTYMCGRAGSAANLALQLLHYLHLRNHCILLLLLSFSHKSQHAFGS